ALLPMASLANSNAVGGYPPMNQGTYSGVIQIRDRADPAIVKSVPVRMLLGTGAGTPTIAAAPAAFSERLAPGASATVNLALSDAGKVCGYVYSVGSNGSWATPAENQYSGTVSVPAATSPGSAADSGEGDGDVPITISAAGLPAGTYHATITIQSQNAQNNGLKVPITLTVT
ncbi:MAG TPA: hypothetical protein VG223_11480, partial [Solirubrobacteraceae bacterium]|nr:hypothetical protein [Solirubrobacteraceae bacterium]